MDIFIVIAINEDKEEHGFYISIIINSLGENTIVDFGAQSTLYSNFDLILKV